MFDGAYSSFPALCLILTGFAATVGAILGESQKITFPAPRSTSTYARLETTLSHDLSSYTLCLHMRTDMSSSITIGLVSYAVEHPHDELLLYNRAGEGLNIYTHQNRVVITGNLPVWDGEWHAICATWRSSDGAWQVYTNGVRRDSGLGLSVGNRVDSGGTWILAQDQDTVGGGFDLHEAFIGELSQLNLWDRVLSPAEIGTDWSVFCSHHGNVIDWAATTISVYGLASSERHLHCEICPQCEHTCLYTNGDFQCSCYAGYALKENGTCDETGLPVSATTAIAVVCSIVPVGVVAAAAALCYMRRKKSSNELRAAVHEPEQRSGHDNPCVEHQYDHVNMHQTGPHAQTGEANGTAATFQNLQRFQRANGIQKQNQMPKVDASRDEKSVPEGLTVNMDSSGYAFLQKSTMCPAYPTDAAYTDPALCRFLKCNGFSEFMDMFTDKGLTLSFLRTASEKDLINFGIPIAIAVAVLKKLHEQPCHENEYTSLNVGQQAAKPIANVDM